MQFLNAPPHMISLANQTVNQFGYDIQSNTKYSFNSLGYRSDIEFTQQNDVIILLGNTLTFGLGVEKSNTFAGYLARELPCPVYNLSWGCYAHTISEQLKFLKEILSVITPKHVILQVNNLNRIRQANGTINFNNPPDQIYQEYIKFIDELKQILTLPHSLLHWDNEQYQIDSADYLIYNKYHIDDCNVVTPLGEKIFGPKTHKLIATKILQNI